MKKRIIIFLIVVIVLICIGVLYTYSTTYPFKKAVFEQKQKYKEKDYVKAYCKGIIEYKLPDKSRVDCLTDEYAIEFDWARKWAEGVGQSKYYAKVTGKKPAVAIILKSPRDQRFVKRLKTADDTITVFEIRSKEYKE